jgi:hypothetical protein
MLQPLRVETKKIGIHSLITSRTTNLRTIKLRTIRLRTTRLRTTRLRRIRLRINPPSVITSPVPWLSVFSKIRAICPARSLVLFVSTASRNPSWQFRHIVKVAVLI